MSITKCLTYNRLYKNYHFYFKNIISILRSMNVINVENKNILKKTIKLLNPYKNT